MTGRHTVNTITSNALDDLYDRLDRIRDAAALHRQGLIRGADLHAVIEAYAGPALDLDAPLRDQLQAAIKALGKSETELARLRGQLADTGRSRDEWKWRAEDAKRGTRCQRERAEQLARLLDEVLRSFVHKGHPGEPCLQTGWIREPTVARWRETLHQPAPAPAATEATDTQKEN